MSTTADATISITCPDWCDFDAAHHANELSDWEGRCIHNGLLVSVEDPTGHGPEWRPWEPERTVRTELIPVGVSISTTTDGRPVATPCIRLVDNVYTVEQIEALIPWLQEAIRLAKEQVPVIPEAAS